MTHYLGMILIPAGEDASDYLPRMLNKHMAGAATKPYTMRSPNNNYLDALPVGYADDTFVEDGLEHRPHVVNPFPRITSWTIGGRFAGVQAPGSPSSAPVSTVDKLNSLEFNSIKTKDFNRSFCPQVLILPNDEWLTSRHDIIVNDKDRWKNRILNQIKAHPTTTAVILDLNIEANLDRQNIISFKR